MIFKVAGPLCQHRPARLILQRDQCFGKVSVQVRMIFKVPQGMMLAGMFNVSMLSLLFVFWDI